MTRYALEAQLAAALIAFVATGILGACAGARRWRVAAAACMHSRESPDKGHPRQHVDDRPCKKRTCQKGR
jgi:hypothetical protein